MGKNSEYFEEYKKAYGNDKDLRRFWEKMINVGAYDTLRKLAQYQNIIFEAGKKQQNKENTGSYEVKIYTKEDVEYAESMIAWILEKKKEM